MFILIRLIINTVALLVAAWAVAGIHLSVAGGSLSPGDWLALGIVGLIFGCVNVIIRPLVLILTLPINILTLGLFTFVVNAMMLILTSWIAQGMGLGFRVDSFGAGFLGALIVSVVSFLLNRLLVEQD
jgi:putative membrane protein